MVKTFMATCIEGNPTQFAHDLDTIAYEGVAATYIRSSNDNSSAQSLGCCLAEARQRPGVTHCPVSG